jgi:hypothetical protein
MATKLGQVFNLALEKVGVTDLTEFLREGRDILQPNISDKLIRAFCVAFILVSKKERICSLLRISKRLVSEPKNLAK